MYVIKNEQGNYWNGRVVEPCDTPNIWNAKLLTFKPNGDMLEEGEKAVEVDVIIKEKGI